MFKHATGVLVCAAVLSTGSAALADTATGNLDVKLTVLEGCQLTTGAVLDFGVVTSVTTEIRSVTNDLWLKCTPGVAYEVGIDRGSGGHELYRHMVLPSPSGDHTMPYSLHRDDSYNNNWGWTKGEDTVTGISDGTRVILPIYGKIPANADDKPAGTYSDTLRIILEF